MNKDAILIALALCLTIPIHIYLCGPKDDSKKKGTKLEKRIEKLIEHDVMICPRKVGQFRDGKFEDVKKLKLRFTDYSVDLPEEECIYKCPKCGIKYRMTFEHGDKYKCNCGLFAQLHGNRLEIWE